MKQKSMSTFLCVLLYLQVAHVGDHGDTLQTFGVAASRATLHLHTRRPQQEVSIAAVQHSSGDLHHLRANFTQSALSWLGV